MPNEMTMEEIMVLKTSMEQKMLELVSEFEKKTGLHVECIQTDSIASLNSRQKSTLTLSVEVSLP